MSNTPVTQAEEIEALAQFLHDEGDFEEAWTARTWPEHPDDDGRRDGGWVKIVPSNVQAKFRDTAARLYHGFIAPRHRQSSSNAGGVDADALAEHFPTGVRGLYDRMAGGIPVQSHVGTNCTCGWCTAATDEHEVRHEWAMHVLASLSTPTAEPPSPCPGDGEKAGTLADIVVQLSAIRTVLREAHFALDDSEDLSHCEEPVHAVPLDNVKRLHRALKACERFAGEDEVWEGPGPLVTRIIDQLGHHLTRSTALQKALEDICDPIAALRRYADGQGRQLDGAVAFQLSNDPNHLKGIARAALTTPPTPDRIGKDAVREALEKIAAGVEERMHDGTTVVVDHPDAMEIARAALQHKGEAS